MSISNVDGGHFQIQDGFKKPVDTACMHGVTIKRTSKTDQKSLKASKIYTTITYNTDARKPIAFPHLIDLFLAESLSSFCPSLLIYIHKSMNGQQRQRNLLHCGR